jgi:FlaA1/EpsC-like NDP-sugar epimerase
VTGVLTRAEEELLLARPVEPLLSDLDRDAVAGRRCLITGAGGSVGGELARQVASCRPDRLTIVDHGEHGLFLIERELRERWPALALDVVLADVTRASSVRETIRRGAPQLVFHAAAYKHVTMAERAVTAAVRVNVLGTAETLAALQDTGARFVLISSDKAAAPRSVMGASKRLAELLTVAHASRGFDPLVVRFGNVLASSGSFVDLMLERMQQGKPIQLTNPDATRYFMSLSEAASLVMKAAGSGRSGETLWLDMGDQVRMGDLVERLQQVGLGRGWARAAVETIGLRAGEKLVEQLATDGIGETSASHPRIRSQRTKPAQVWRWELTLRMLRRRIAEEDGAGVLSLLRSAVPDYEPSDEAWRCVGLSAADAAPRHIRTA